MVVLRAKTCVTGFSHRLVQPRWGCMQGNLSVTQGGASQLRGSADPGLRCATLSASANANGFDLGVCPTRKGSAESARLAGP